MSSSISAPPPSARFTLVIHGGAGLIQRSLDPHRLAYRATLHASLQAGYLILSNGGTALDAVQAAVVHLEDSPIFNAGVGSVYTSIGTHEMDACVVCGKTKKAGAVGAVQRIKNPIVGARAVMERTQHCMLIGSGADNWAGTEGLSIVSNEYFDTDHRKKQLKEIIQQNITTQQLDHTAEAITDISNSSISISPPPTHPTPSSCGQEDRKYGTVGAVALDSHGNLAAATSTGGTTNKLPGRVGDTPIIGAGTYADNSTCAVSCTGLGESFMRTVCAFDVSAAMRYKGWNVSEASEYVMKERFGKLGPEAEGGWIAVGKDGSFTMPFNTAGMYRGVVDQENKPVVMVWKDE